MARKTGTELLLFVGILALGGCRAVIGIDDLQRGGDASVDASAEAAPADAAPDVTSDVAPPADAGDGGRTLAECNGFCRTDGGAGAGGAAFSSEMHSCMCQGATLKACAAECGGYCPNGGTPSSVCETCILQQAINGVCMAKASTCSSSCQGFLQCVASCK